jgi:hypothetical protein
MKMALLFRRGTVMPRATGCRKCDGGGDPSGCGVKWGNGQFAVIQSVAPTLGLDVCPVNVRDRPEIERPIAGFARFAPRRGSDSRKPTI